MSRDLSALGRRADSALHIIQASDRRRTAKRQAEFVLLLLACLIIGFAAGTAAFAIARQMAGIIETIMGVLP